MQKKLDRRVFAEQEEVKGEICDYVEVFCKGQSLWSYWADYVAKRDFKLRKRPEGKSTNPGTIHLEENHEIPIA